MKIVRANGIDQACLVAGEVRRGLPWLVFSHSLACDHSMWAPQVDVFSSKFNVLAYDTRGHGASSVPVGPYTLDQLADDLFGLLDAQGIERCHYVGLSMGGMIGQTAALREPARFASLVLADTTSRVPQEAAPTWESRIAAAGGSGMGAVAAATLERWFTAAFRAREPQIVARIDHLIRNTPVAGYVACSRAIMALDLTERLASIECPVLVVVGEQDPGTPPAMSEVIARAIPGARFVPIPEAAHLSNLEQPARFNSALQDFLPHGPRVSRR